MEQIKVLIVDDEENIRNVIKEYAKVENYLVKEAADGKEGGRAARGNGARGRAGGGKALSGISDRNGLSEDVQRSDGTFGHRSGNAFLL